MMSILEYAEDVNKSVEEIYKLCDRLGIGYKDENTDLTEDDIVLLDGEVASSLDEEETDTSEEAMEQLEEEALEDHVEQIVIDSKINIDNSSNKQKLKSKSERTENNKAKFQKDKKELYKHREKLMTNEEQEDNIVLYKEDMTVGDVANMLGVNSVEIIKKLMKLGIMARVNNPLAFEVVEIVCLDYGKELKNAESKDISNFEKFEINEKEENL